MTTSTATADLERARTLARVLDSAIGVPGTKFRIGLDPILGLLPGGGDFVSALLSGYIVLVATRLGAPRSVIIRMLGNVLVDFAGGSVPIVGDLFDAGFKSNMRNVDLLERYVATPAQVSRRSKLIEVAVIIAIVSVGLGLAALSFFVLRWAWHALTT